jgi:hypothetical protein
MLSFYLPFPELDRAEFTTHRTTFILSALAFFQKRNGSFRIDG